ncbi:hypothetical protein Belba_0631 [Belliella baltica DSM 15883]|uniref:Uncharacterized protein n=1 Tax=Belliella baltica (strain DSM 15883 / CIP 108006 / LMG 21964 / BA134) TaxID=866536 RepID=I3Z218_BELBD|nr:hypothetical protein [Belliella baltica]AFL83286.1 hypothetical protein Belba_0631 [Belliella baltica DSM 15883]
MQPVKEEKENINLFKQRITLIMVMFFCMLVSGMEYFPNLSQDENTEKQETSTEKEAPQQNQTFLDVAVDAVVPFVTTLGSQVYYIIYEIVNFEAPSASLALSQAIIDLEFREILFERIISTNAP